MHLSRRVSVRLATTAILLGVVVLLRIWLSHAGSLPGDRLGLARFFSPGRQRNAAYEVEDFFGVLGAAPVAAFTVLFAAGVVARRLGGRIALGVVLSVGVVLVVAVLKASFGPTAFWQMIRPDRGPNYPSGHTAYATAVFGYLGLLARRHDQPESVVLAVILIVGMGPALALSGAHLVSDIVGGYLLGIAWLSLVSLCIPPSQGAKNGEEM